MQPVIEKIYQNTLSDNEKFKAMFMDDANYDYFVFAWTENDNILYLGYGKEQDYLNHMPDISADMETATVSFPYKDLTEKEAYVLSRYEQIKIERFGLKKLTDIGVLT